MEVHSFQGKTIFSRNCRSQGFYLYLKQRRKETDTRTGNDSLIWYSWDMRSILRLSSRRGELSLMNAAALQVCWLSWSLSMSPAAAGGSIVQVNLNWPTSLHGWEAHGQSWSICVRISIIIYCCVHKCQRTKLLYRAAHSNIQLSMIPCWTGLNLRCAEAALTLEFVLSVKHSEKSVARTVPDPSPRQLWMTPVEHSLSLIYSHALFQNFMLQCLLSELASGCTTLKHQSS